jgi:hypothetical protein
MLLSPLVAEEAPTSPEYVPEYAVLLIEVVPLVFQPERLPVSKSPLVMPAPPVEVTVIVTDVLWVVLPSVPFTVTVYTPGATDEPTVTVSVEGLPAVREAGLNDAIGPEGKTLARRLRGAAEPLVTTVLIAEVLLLPGAIARLAGLAAIEKSLVVVPFPTIACDRSHRSVSFDQVDCIAKAPLLVLTLPAPPC